MELAIIPMKPVRWKLWMMNKPIRQDNIPKNVGGVNERQKSLLELNLSMCGILYK